MNDLFAQYPAVETPRNGMTVLHGFADPAALFPQVAAIARVAPFRHMTTPGGRRMSVAMTNCGTWGWISDQSGYRYGHEDALTGTTWPQMPAAFHDLAARAAVAAGFASFDPDACLINRYSAGSRLTAHQDRNERDFAHPIVSVSLGLPATFFVGLGSTRSGPTRAISLRTGDVVVWGGPARLAYHGVREVPPGHDALFGPYRVNLTFRRAG